MQRLDRRNYLETFKSGPFCLLDDLKIIISKKHNQSKLYSKFYWDAQFLDLYKLFYDGCVSNKTYKANIQKRVCEKILI